MSFVLFFCFIALAGSAIGGYLDIKTSEIPDEVPLGICIIGIILYILDFLINNNPIAIVSIITISIFFIFIGYIFFWLNQWGEADALMLASLGVLMPGCFCFIENSFLDAFLFANKFLIISFIIGSIWAILYSVLIMVKEKKTIAFFKYLCKKEIELRFFFVFVILGIFFAYFLFIPMFYLFYKFAKFTENNIYKKKIKTKNLQEGDVIAEKIKKLNINGK
ncbi:MAG: hypothetical protein B6U87_02270, partial [Candidatus Aenigmarchaeota archaeon ex4484_52]